MNPAQLIQNRSTLTIFRDCLKLASRMVQDPNKVISVRRLIKQQFTKNKERNSTQFRAVRGISNYIIYTVQQDYKIPRKQQNIFEQQQEQQEQNTHQ